MTNRELTVSRPQGLDLSDDTLGVLLRLSGKLLQSGLCPSGLRNEGAVLAVILTGRELGYGPMTSLRNVDFINQQGAIRSNLLAALVYRAYGHAALQWVSSDEKHATYRFKNPGMTEYQEYTYTIERAQRAKLTTKDSWTKDPESMLRARCISNIVKIAFQDVGLGILTVEEAEDIDTSNDVAGEVVSSTSVPTMANALAADARRKGINPRSEQYETYLSNDPDAGRIAAEYANKPPAPGPPPDDPLDPAIGYNRPATKLQYQELKVVMAQIPGFKVEDGAAVVKTRYDASSTKDLDYNQLEDLIQYLKTLIPTDEEPSADGEFEEI